LYCVKNLPPQPNAFQEIGETNMGKINPDEEKQREMEIGPNCCAVYYTQKYLKRF
jgi:hypothetical protein